MVIHLIHHPVSAKRFVEPLVKSLIKNKIDTELWLEDRGYLTDFINSIDCPKRFAKFDLSFNLLKTLIRLVLLTKRFAKFKPQAIHTHQGRASFVPLLAGKIAKIPIRIYHNHGAPYLEHRGVLRFGLWLLEFINCRLATSVLAVSKYIREKMIQHHITTESKCTLLGEGSICGIDLTEFSTEKFDQTSMTESRQRLGIASDAYVVLYVGRPFKRKGFNTLLNAWQLMEPPNRHSILLIAGCDSKDVEKITRNTTKNIIALGYTKDLHRCYAACDIVVLPSYREGLPYSLLEGAAAGKALIGSDIPGIDSTIINGKNGLLVPAKNPSKLADALLELGDNSDLRKQMGKAGRKYVEQHFDRIICLKQLFDYYGKVGISSYNK